MFPSASQAPWSHSFQGVLLIEQTTSEQFLWTATDSADAPTAIAFSNGLKPVGAFETPNDYHTNVPVTITTPEHWRTPKHLPPEGTEDEKHH